MSTYHGLLVAVTQPPFAQEQSALQPLCFALTMFYLDGAVMSLCFLATISIVHCQKASMASIFYVWVVEQEVEMLSLRRDVKYTATYCALENMSQFTCKVQIVCSDVESPKYAPPFPAVLCIRT